MKKKISYKQSTNVALEQLVKLYTNANWTSYTKNPEKLQRAVSNSREVLTAWEEDRLVGLIRAIGDGETILYIQDILVLNSHKRRGIGRELVTRLLDLYPDVRQKVLLTDERPETRGFYKSLGFSACDDGKLVAFAKFD
ncbi:MAG: GNAT family N-acetyltransferase [Bacteroidota bacterium]